MWVELPDGVKSKVTEDPKEYNNAVEIKRGGKKLTNKSASPVAQGGIDATKGDIEVKYTNSLFIIVPTGVSVSLIAGICLVTAGPGYFFFIKRKRAQADLV